MNTKNLHLAISLLVVILALIACGGNDNEEIEEKNNVVGEWSGQRYDGTGKTRETCEECDGEGRVKIN